MQLIAEEGETSRFMQGHIDGEAAADGNPIWFLAGCLLGVGGVIGAYVIEPAVPTEILLGKDNEYILGYSLGFQKKSTQLNTKHAVTGCVTFNIVYFTFLLVMSANIPQ